MIAMAFGAWAPLGGGVFQLWIKLALCLLNLRKLASVGRKSQYSNISSAPVQSGRQDEFSASVLFLSSRHMVAPQFEDLPGFDGVACCAPRLRDRARSSETEFGLL